MDGSRRYSEIFAKTQAGVDALTSARGTLSSSARQLLILIDGQRDFDELSSIFGEEALYRMLLLLESQGYVQPLRERVNAEGDPISAPASAPIEESQAATVVTPAAPRRYLAVPVAIAASLLTALAIVSWFFAREQVVAPNPPEATPAPAVAAAAPDTAARPKASAAATQATPVAPPVRPESTLASAPPAAPEPEHPPASAPSLSPVPARPVTPQGSAPFVEATPRAPLRIKAAPESTVLPANPPPASTGELSTTAEAAPSQATAPDQDAVPGAGPAPALQMLHVRSRVLPAISKRALQSGIYAGSAVVRLHVNNKGTVERVELVSATPPQVYGPDVQQALEQWTFEPPSNPAQYTLELDFRQQNPPAGAPASKPTDAP